MRTVPETANPKRLFRFGIFELDGHTGELRKGGKLRPRFQGQPLEILLYLLEHPEEVVTREALRQRLWPADTFVDYDHSLNAAVNKLREALNDSAENPRFIQTIPRKGYRFIAPVEKIGEGAPTTSEFASAVSRDSPDAPPSNLILSDARELPAAPQATVRVLFSLIQIMYLFFYVVSLARLHRLDALLSSALQHSTWLFVLLVATALAGIPIRLYLLSAMLFGYAGLRRRFLTLFPILFPMDEFWALAPFLLVERIGLGLALAVTAALLYVPFSQRSLLLMEKSESHSR
jgi:cholera toxin transcriptional activator